MEQGFNEKHDLIRQVPIASWLARRSRQDNAAQAKTNRQTPPLSIDPRRLGSSALSSPCRSS